MTLTMKLFRRVLAPLTALCAVLAAPSAWALGERQFVRFDASAQAVVLADQGRAARPKRQHDLGNALRQQRRVTPQHRGLVLVDEGAIDQRPQFGHVILQGNLGAVSYTHLTLPTTPYV